LNKQTSILNRSQDHQKRLLAPAECRRFGGEGQYRPQPRIWNDWKKTVSNINHVNKQSAVGADDCPVSLQGFADKVQDTKAAQSRDYAFLLQHEACLLLQVV
jgi:hypothetical protein